jgi:hypothetical protein
MLMLAALAVAGCGSTAADKSNIATGKSNIAVGNEISPPQPTAAEQRSMEIEHAAFIRREKKEAKIKAHKAELARAVAHKRAVAKAKIQAAQAKKLHEYEQSPEYKKVQAEARRGEEYEREHKSEEEAKEKEYEQRLHDGGKAEEEARSRVELSASCEGLPEQAHEDCENDYARQKDEEESKKEVEAIKEGQRIREREEGKVP